MGNLALIFAGVFAASVVLSLLIVPKPSPCSLLLLRLRMLDIERDG